MNPVQKELLRQLSDGELHSGTALGEQLGISRAAVWKQLQLLHSFGVEINSEHRQGYRLSHPVSFLDSGKIEQWLVPHLRPRLPVVETMWGCDSTNSELMRRLHDGAEIGSVLLAEHQTAGRGRRGKGWVSPFGSSLYLSLLWRFPGGPMTLSGLSIVVGIAVAETVREYGLVDVQLKWPNDIYLQGRKLGGVLIDLEGEAEGPTSVVIGIGLNVEISQQSGQTIDQPWISLAEQMSLSPSRNQLAAALLNRLVPLLDRFQQGGMVPFIGEWDNLDRIRNHPVTLQLGEKTVHGVARGVDHMGALQVETNGVIQRYFSGDVSVRPVRSKRETA